MPASNGLGVIAGGSSIGARRRVEVERRWESRWSLLFAALLSLALYLGGGSSVRATTIYQTNISGYDPRIDLRTDGVVVHLHGHEATTIAQALKHWREVGGTPVYRMWFIGSDAGQFFTGGKFDGTSHTDAIETGPANDQFWQPGRPYMVPTPEWNEYMREITRHAIDHGAIGVAPEEPLAHGRAGYSPAFQRAWEAYYGEPWQAPLSSIEAYWKASKLKSHLYFETVKAVLEEAKSYGRSVGKDVQVILPTHSLLSHAAGHMIFPNGAAARLPELDGLIGQVWTGPIGWSLGRYEGRQLTRDNGFFDSAWLLYSSFVNLTRGTDKSMYLLADPVEDDPNYRWDQYHLWYNQTLVTKLMFPSVSDYEVMPWPDRIFLPGYSTGGGSPGPAPYLTQLMVNVQALADMPAQTEVRWHGGTQGIGVLVGDTLGWQRGGPNSSTMDSLHGLALPLLRRGIPVEVLAIERAGDEGYLDPFDLLLVSYDMWKPLEPEAHAALAEWVRQGGILVFFDGDDAYNRVDEWWRQAGYNAPVEHLFAELGLNVDPATRQTASGAGTESEWREILRAEADYHNLENLERREVDLSDLLPAEAILVRFRDPSTHDGWGPFLTTVEFESLGADGERRLVSFRANGGEEEAAYLDEVMGPGGVDSHRRFADATGHFTYRFPVAGATEAKIALTIGNHFSVTVLPVSEEVGGDGISAAGSFPTEIATQLHRLTDQRSVPVTSYVFDGVRASAYQTGIGDGAFLYVGVPSALFAASREGADVVRKLSAYVIDELAGGEYREDGVMLLERGAYVIAHSLNEDRTLRGAYVDLFDPNLPVVDEYTLAPGDSALLYDVTSLLGQREPAVLYASRELLVEEHRMDGGEAAGEAGATGGSESAEATSYLVSAGPWQTRGVIRLYAGERTPVKIAAYAMRGFGRRLDHAEVEDLDPWIERLQGGQLQPVSSKWEWDEASRSLKIDFDQWHSGVIVAVDWQ